MKQRVFAFITAMVMLLACAMPAFAETKTETADEAKNPVFDETVLQSADDIGYSEFEDDNETFYFVRSLGADERWFWTAEGDCAILVYPCLVVDEEKAAYNLCFLYDARTQPGLERASFNVAGKKYTFTGLNNSASWFKGSRDSLWMSNAATVELNSSSLSLLNDIAMHRGEKITLVLEGTSNRFEITLGAAEINGIVHLYNLFVQGGGLNAENLKKLPVGSGTNFVLG